MNNRILLAIPFALALAGCASHSFNVDDYKSYTVLLEPDEGSNPPVLKVISPPQGDDPEGKKDGYIGFAKGETGGIAFGLAKEVWGREFCTGDPETTAQWVITKIEYSAFGDEDKEKGEKFGGRQPGWVKQSIGKVSVNGVAYQKTKDTGQTFVAVGNENKQSGPKFVYYQVTAARCTDGKIAVTDPGIRNGGKK